MKILILKKIEEPQEEHKESVIPVIESISECKYPKTDFTYSPLSRDRVELAPGQIAVPNMSRRSLSQFRIQGPLVSPAEFEQIEAEMKSHKKQTWDTAASKLRKRYTNIDSSEDEGTGTGYNYKAVDQRWWLTRIVMSIITTITETTSSMYHSLVGPPEKYPYRGYRQSKKGVVSQVGAILSAPFLWIYSMFHKIVTNTITTVTETITPNHVGEYNSYKSRIEKRTVKKKSWWPWLLLLLIPLVGYGSYYTYENYDNLAMPNFTDFKLDLSEFSSLEMPRLSMPDIKLPDISLTRINISLPDISYDLPEVTKTYQEYKEIVQNRMSDASDYMKVVAGSCYEEIIRLWYRIVG
ncbi:hypothetical protein EVAR_38979_1 [Eumeta japonica]|uniref:Uncharacterized protein n=1 Tax=Eumeta variegata TaxID=151549 RepID=A0A4C1WB52_EUMVA|nr:hypothetical protein EVAR_38979_1 [Eumeta japonica]